MPSFTIKEKTVKITNRKSMSELPSWKRAEQTHKYGRGKYKYYITISGKKHIVKADNIEQLKLKLRNYWSFYS